jgi:hypothetical protein
LGRFIAIVLVLFLTPRLATQRTSITSIPADGERGGDMLSVNGIAYSRITRLTFDGRRRASVSRTQQHLAHREWKYDCGRAFAERFLLRAFASSWRMMRLIILMRLKAGRFGP